MTRIPSLAAVFVAAALLLTRDGTAQYRGWYVAATFKDSTWSYAGDGGLFFVHPRTPGAPIPIGPLPVGLTGVGRSVGPWGAWSLARQPTTGAWIVGEKGAARPALVHVLSLSGATVTARVQFSVGTFRNGGLAVAGLPSGDILVGPTGMASGPLATALLGVIQVATGAVSTVPLTGTLGQVEAIALDTTAPGPFPVTLPEGIERSGKKVLRSKRA